MQEHEMTTMGQLSVGDMVPSETGEYVPVSEAYEEHVPESMYLLETEDGGEVKVSGNHLVYVVLDVDRESAGERLKAAKKLRKRLSPDVIKRLSDLALEERLFEMHLADMIAFLGIAREPEYEAVVIRTAEAIGHIAEDTSVIEDLETGERHVEAVVRMYDANVFAQQLLSVMGVRKFKKMFPTRFGRVTTVDSIANYEGDMFLPKARS